MKDYSNLKKVAIVALVCLNIGLCLALVYGAGASEASAQARPGYRNDYMVVTGRYGTNQDAIYVMDLAQRRLAAWRFDARNQRLVPFLPGRELNSDFNREDQ